MTKKFQEGDIFFSKIQKEYHFFKLLNFDRQFDTYHVKVYLPTNKLPEITELDVLKIHTHHTPIDSNGFDNPQFFTNIPITKDELTPFHQYLRQTHTLNYISKIAGNYYQTAYSLTNKLKLAEAIEEYTKAIDLIPNFSEAINNRGLCRMDLKQWEEAITDFKLSLTINAQNSLTEFLLGECYFHTGNFDKSKEHLLKVQAKQPDNLEIKNFLQKLNNYIAKL